MVLLEMCVKCKDQSHRKKKLSPPNIFATSFCTLPPSLYDKCLELL